MKFPDYVELKYLLPKAKASTTWKSELFRAFHTEVEQRVSLSPVGNCSQLSLFLNNSVIDTIKTHPFAYFSQFLTCTSKHVQKVATAFPRLPLFSPDEARIVF